MANSQLEPLDLCLFYADLGRPYLPLIRTMTESARRIMPDARLVLLTPTPSEELYSMFDLPVWLKVQSTAKTICYDKSRAIITWQAQSTRPCVFIDPDLEFRHPLQMPDEDVGLLWRKKTAHPINSGMIFARPGAPEFWKKYGNTVACLPKTLHQWFADQLAFSVIIGALHEAGDVIQAYDARVKLLAYEKICCQPEHATEETLCLHYKGIRKPGNGWEQFFTHPPKFGDGKSLLASA